MAKAQTMNDITVNVGDRMCITRLLARGRAWHIMTLEVVKVTEKAVQLKGECAIKVWFPKKALVLNPDNESLKAPNYDITIAPWFTPDEWYYRLEDKESLFGGM